MKVFSKILCSLLLVVSCTLGLFTGCGDPLANLKVSLMGDGLNFDGEVYTLNLVKDPDDENLASTVVTASVSGASGGLLTEVGWDDYDRSFLDITVSKKDNNTATITALNATTNGTIVNVYSKESKDISCKLVVNVLVKAQSATLKESVKHFGIPIGQDYSLNPIDLLNFSPINATVPAYTFEVAGRMVKTDEVFKLGNRPTTGKINIKAYPTNKKDFTDEAFKNLTIEIKDVRTYMALNDVNTTLSKPGGFDDVENLELVLNKNANTAFLQINTPDDELVEIFAKDTNNLKDNFIAYEINNKNKTIKFTGLNVLDKWKPIWFDIKVAGVTDAKVISKKIMIRVVNMPDRISFNGDLDTPIYTLRVFDIYKSSHSGMQGTKLSINLAPMSNIYKNLKIMIDTAYPGTNPNLINSLLVNEQPFTDNYETTSGSTLYFRNLQGYGNIMFNVIATDTDIDGENTAIIRKLLIVMEQSVTAIEVSDVYLDQKSKSLILQYDEYGANNSFAVKTVNFKVYPNTASANTVDVRCEDENIIKVSVLNKETGRIQVRAIKTGTTKIYFEAQSGVTYFITVRVIDYLTDITINLDKDTNPKYLGPTKTKNLEVNGETVQTLEYAYITDNTSVYLRSDVYPRSAANNIKSTIINAENGKTDIAFAIADSTERISLRTLKKGDVTLVFKVEYDTLKSSGVGRGVNIDTSIITIKFKIHVFIPINYIEVSKTNVELLAFNTNNNNTSVYDNGKNQETLTVKVFDDNSEVKASSAVWSKEISSVSDKLELSTYYGATTTITAKPMSSLEDKINITLSVSIIDINNTVYTKEINVSIKKVKRITQIYIDKYGNQNKRGLYFENYKINDKFELNLNIEPANATNKNLEFLLFDANKISSYADAANRNNVVRLDTGSRDMNGRIIYDYYEVITRSPSDNPTPKECVTASVVREENGKYSVRHKNPGYAFLYIIPQDILSEPVENIANLIPLLQNISDTSSICRIPITVADGQTVRYRLFTAEDVACIDDTERGLASKYYLMNTIDMSNYLIKNPDWQPIGNMVTPFSGSIVSIGCEEGNGVPQSIVGWNLQKTLNQINPTVTSPGHSMFYGIFGAVIGEIKYVNFFVNNIFINQNTRVINTIKENQYDFGVLAGRLISREGQRASISNVNVTCANFNYSLNKNYSNNYDIDVNLGSFGLVDADCVVDNFSAKISAKISSDDLKINFGGVAGRNKGILGTVEQNSKNYASVRVEIKNLDNQKISQLPLDSNIGAVVGKNLKYNVSGTPHYGVINKFSVDGYINTQSSANINVGGIVGTNYAKVYDATSAVLISANGNVGGVAGVNNYSLSNVSYEIYSTESTNLGMTAKGNVGGIAGLNSKGDIEWAMVVGYDKNTEKPNIIVDGEDSILGGIAGVSQVNSTIKYSFANVSMRASNILGGLVGQSAMTTIKDCYARIFLDGASKIGALVGHIKGETTTYAVYAEAQKDYKACGVGELTTTAQKTIILVGNIASFTSTTNLLYVDKLTAQNNLNYFESNGFVVAGVNSAGWNIKDGTNDNYPYLKTDKNTDFVRVIPTTLSVDAVDLETFTDGRINTKLNATNQDTTKDSKKIIIMYQRDNTEKEIIPLKDLFALKSDPIIPIDLLNLDITCSSSSVIQLISGVSFNDYQLRVVGTGTVVLKFVSKQNRNAKDFVQISVINGYNNFELHKGADATGDLVSATNGIDILLNHTTQAYVKYLFNDAQQDNVDGGLRFSVSKNDIFTMSVDGWTAGINEFYNYHYASAERITFNAIKYLENPLPVKVTPFITASFYELNKNGEIQSTKKLVYDILDEEMALNYDTTIYKGAESIKLGIAKDTIIYAGDALSSAVTLFTNNYKQNDNIDKHIGYSITNVDTQEKIVDTSIDLNTDIMNVVFEKEEYSELHNRLVIPFTISLTNHYKNNFKVEQNFIITFWACDVEGNPDMQMTASLSWKFIPQKINHISMAHFSDAVNEGPKLQQAGSLPTNTIIAGNFGLMIVKVALEYAQYDYVDIVSDITNDSRMMFDQRVLRNDVDGPSYYSWQDGVEIIDGGIRLYRVSNIDGSFDGTYYIRTLVSELQPAGAVFTAHVNVHMGDKVYSNSLSMKVYVPDELSISYANYNENTGFAYVASGTGFSNISQVPVQNQNELIVKVGKTFRDVNLSVSDPRASIVSANGKYYLNTGDIPAGETIRVSLVGKQNLSGLINEVKRNLNFQVVDFYLNSITKGFVNGTDLANSFRLSYIKNKKYDLRIFDGATLDNLHTISALSFDHTNMALKMTILDTINKLNGFGESAYSGWSAYYRDEKGQMVVGKLNSMASGVDGGSVQKKWINNDYCFYNDTSSGYQVEANGVSNTSKIRYDIAFKYLAGKFTLVPTAEITNECRGYYSHDITLDFYQITSQEHAQPIYTEKDLLSMQSGIDYILLNDITIAEDWTPIATEIRSLNGNGYTINFRANTINSNTGNFGLFDKINKDTIVKNVKIKLNNNVTLSNNAKTLQKLRLGMIAGVNEGVIYNCSVYGNNQHIGLVSPVPNTVNADFMVGGLVGENMLGGAISNSRIVDTDIVAFGKVAGLVSLNNGNISSSYYTGGVITNTAKIVGTNVATAGLVVENKPNSTISGCYTGGAYTKIDESGNNVLIPELEKTRDAIIQSGVRSSGFVFENNGEIQDSYSAVQILSIESSGFVFTNASSAKVERCYSVCLTTNNDASTTSVSMPFIGIDSATANKNNNSNPNGIVNCYFYDTGFSVSALRLEEAKSLEKEHFLGKKGFTEFDEFIFSRNDDKMGTGSEFTGIWIFPSARNMYYDFERCKSNRTFAEFEYDGVAYLNFGPKLVGADLIATPRLELDEEQEIDPNTGAALYSYTKSFNGYFDTLDNQDFNTNYAYDPMVITSPTQFNEVFRSAIKIDDSDTEWIDGVKKTRTVKKVVDDIRLACNIDQSAIDSASSLSSPYINYAGIFEGNNFVMKNVNLAENNDKLNQFGLFGTISRAKQTKTQEIEHIGTVKNFNMVVNSVSCSQVAYVGALAGIVNNGNLYNISVDGNNGRVIGNNAVGGVVGIIKGTSRAGNINCDLSVTSNYKLDKNLLYNADLLRALSVTNEVNKMEKMGYAGGVFGVADLMQFGETKSVSDRNQARLENIYATGNSSIVGKVAGGIAGFIGTDTVLNNTKKVIESNSRIKGYAFAGGIAGQNDGVIGFAKVEYNQIVQTVLDSADTGQEIEVDAEGKRVDVNNSVFEGGADSIGVGGLVGINIGTVTTEWTGGKIFYGSNKINVRNSNGSNIGGIVGVAYGGDIRAVFTTGNIYGDVIANLGGIVGYVSDFAVESDVLKTKINNPFGQENNIKVATTLDYCVALNNYLVKDFNYYQNIYDRSLTNSCGHGGMVGYCHELNQLYTTHTASSSEGELSNLINYYVGRIYNKIKSRNDTTKLLEETDIDNVIDLNAVGKSANNEEFRVATAETRGWMLANKQLVFGGWDEYCVNLDGSMPSIEIKDVPNIIYISTIQDFAKIYWHLDKTYILKNDIDFKDYKKSLVPIGSTSSAFTGIFDGKGHSLSNLNITNITATNVGIFGATDGAIIRNLKVNNLKISTNLSKKIPAYVGGLVGYARNTSVNMVSIDYDSGISADRYGIKTNANFVGGMFGHLFATENGESKITNCYVNNVLDLTDNDYDESIYAYLGGFAGKIDNNVLLQYVFSAGDLKLALDISNLDQITHLVGGFAGNVNGHYKNNPGKKSGSVEIISKALVSDVNIDILNARKDIYVGGSFGLSNKFKASGIDSAGDIDIKLDIDIEDANQAKAFMVGGFAGVSNGDIVDTMIVSNDINLYGKYNLKGVDKAVPENKHAVGGVVGSIRANSDLSNGYSIASIYNYAEVGNVDAYSYSFANTNSFIDYDSYLSLCPSDKVGKGVSSIDIFEINMYDGMDRLALNTYPRLNVENWNNWLPSITRYNKIYTGNNVIGDRKTAPIVIDSNNTLNEELVNKYEAGNYKYYLQINDILNNNLVIENLEGLYNGGGYVLNSKLIDVLNYQDFMPKAETYGIFAKTIDSDKKGAIITGVRAKVDFSSKVATGSKIAGLVSELTAKSRIFACSVFGDIRLGIESGDAVVGGLVAVNNGQIANSFVDLDIDLYGAVGNAGGILSSNGNIVAGGLVGISQNKDNYYTLINCYARGNISNKNTSSNTFIGGIAGQIGAMQTVNFYNKYCYSTIAISSGANAKIDAVTPKRLGGATNTNGIYYDSQSITKPSADWNAFNVYDVRSLNELNFGDGYKMDYTVNYGLPYLRTDKNVKNTGDGSQYSPYLINSASQLAWCLKNNSKANYILENNIDFSFIKNNYQANDFAGNLNGNGFAISNLNTTLFSEILSGASVEKLKLTTTGALTNILAETLSGNVNEIYLDATSGAIVKTNNGIIKNGLSKGATFGDNVVNCYTENPNVETGLDLDKWVYTGSSFELFTFVETLGDNYKFGVSVQTNVYDYTIFNTDQLDRIINFINKPQGIYGFTIRYDGESINLGNKILKQIGNSNTGDFVNTKITNGVIYRDNNNTSFITNKSTLNPTYITSIDNCGIMLFDDYSIFGFDAKALNYEMTNCIAYANGGGCLLMSNIVTENVTLTLTDNKIYSKNNSFMGLINSNDSTTTSVVLTNTQFASGALLNKNTGTINMTITNSLLNSELISAENKDKICLLNSGTINVSNL